MCISFYQNQHQEKSSKTITVFVGNITERASDALVRQVLTVCTCRATCIYISLYCIKMRFLKLNFMLKFITEYPSVFSFVRTEMWSCGELEACAGDQGQVTRYSNVNALFIMMRAW